MYLYNLTLQKSTGIYQTISGSFTAPKLQEIVISKGNILELMGFDQK
jgi:splicing factor 3B subunit 3